MLVSGSVFISLQFKKEKVGGPPCLKGIFLFLPPTFSLKVRCFFSVVYKEDTNSRLSFFVVEKKRCFCCFVVFVGIRRDEEEKRKTDGFFSKNESLEYVFLYK